MKRVACLGTAALLTILLLFPPCFCEGDEANPTLLELIGKDGKPAGSEEGLKAALSQLLASRVEQMTEKTKQIRNQYGQGSRTPPRLLNTARVSLPKEEYVRLKKYCRGLLNEPTIRWDLVQSSLNCLAGVPEDNEIVNLMELLLSKPMEPGNLKQRASQILSVSILGQQMNRKAKKILYGCAIEPAVKSGAFFPASNNLGVNEYADRASQLASCALQSFLSFAPKEDVLPFIDSVAKFVDGSVPFGSDFRPFVRAGHEIADSPNPWGPPAPSDDELNAPY